MIFDVAAPVPFEDTGMGIGLIIGIIVFVVLLIVVSTMLIIKRKREDKK